VTTLRWADAASFRVFPGKTPLREVVDTLRREGKRWAVLERRGRHFYAFSATELEDYASTLGAGPAEAVLALREGDESETVPTERPPAEWDFEARRRPELPKPSAGRLVAVDAGGRPAAVGTPVYKTRAKPPNRDLGEMRGMEPPAPAPVDAVLSAKGPAEISVGSDDAIEVRLELAAGAAPFAHAVAAALVPAEKVTAILSLNGDALEAPEGRILRLDPPAAGRPTLGAFVVRGRSPGMAGVAVIFKQGASQLGTVSFAIQVRDGAARDGVVAGSASAASPDAADEDVLTLLVHEQRAGNEVRYAYQVFSRSLGLNFQEFESAPFQPRNGSTGAAPLDYVQGVYDVVARALVDRDDLKKFSRELQAVGVDLCRQLFREDLAELLWKGRDRIRAVQVTSWEPLIPWELLRLRHPVTGLVDERYLGEYGLVRSLSGRMGPVRLKARDWRTLASAYPNGSYPAVGAEVESLNRLLQDRGIAARAIPPDAEPMLEALERPDFDVLHIACHGGASPARIESALLVLGDRMAAGKIVPVTVDARTVAGTANLRAREPLLFLNACESGRQAPLLTAWGGWPQTFWQAGAGAFVGTSWSVREAPATDFSLAFYGSLLGGSTLLDAAVAGRAAAKARPDASWLAYVVYGHPTARLQS